jgi:hypothetical protein
MRARVAQRFCTFSPEPGIFAVPVRRENGRVRGLPGGGPVQVARHEKPGEAFEGHVFDRVAVIRPFTAEDGLEWRVPGQAVEFGAPPDVLPDLFGPLFPAPPVLVGGGKPGQGGFAGGLGVVTAPTEQGRVDGLGRYRRRQQQQRLRASMVRSRGVVFFMRIRIRGRVSGANCANVGFVQYTGWRRQYLCSR